jgi:dienelactone hydrolase
MAEFNYQISGPDNKPIFITSLNIGVLSKNSKLVFIQHGDNGSSQSVHNSAIANAFCENGYAVVLIDDEAPNQFEAGKIEEVRAYPDDPETAEEFSKNLALNHANRMEAAIVDVLGMLEFTEKYCVAGHSLGASSALEMAVRRPNEILNVTAVAPARLDDIDAQGIICPVRIIVGSEDDLKPPAKSFHNRALNEASRGGIIIIDGADHGFTNLTNKLTDALSELIRKQSTPAANPIHAPEPKF